MRIGAAQLIILDTPPHAAVSATVAALSGHRASGLVNAVLRRLVTEGEPDMNGAPLHEVWSHPQSLTARWVSRYGREKTEKLLEWNNSVPGIGGCFPDAEGDLEKGLYLDDYRIIERTGEIPIDSKTRNVYLQDEAAAITGRVAAELAAGGSVLEIAAAPGGKTHHLQAAAKYVVSADSSFSRMHRWRKNSARLHWRDSIPVVTDGRMPSFGSGFDTVFIDAPCTNTGVYRRRCDARWKWSDEYLENSVTLQRELLLAACELVVPGGFLIYSTCSLEEEENRLQAEMFERSRDNFQRISLRGPAELVMDGMICIFPFDHQVDGMFAAAWKRDK
ncbi:MAG: RsmB/NOP family class I SAM-dependent RNA methyltransferase [Candidatus Aegiribacteria sp.]|nr:RsmB/NOP family class I SAM-dependent RNA methyltransferase [Candidatus Aegiribacteria sp.]